MLSTNSGKREARISYPAQMGRQGSGKNCGCIDGSLAADPPQYDLKDLLGRRRQRRTFYPFPLKAVLGKKYWEAMKPGSGPLYEGLPIVLLKAMGFGNCVLAVDVPYNVEVVGDAGIPFSKHGDDLTNKLQDLIDNPAKRKNLQKRAVERIKKCYSWEDVTDKYEMLFKKVTNMRRAQSVKLKAQS